MNEYGEKYLLQRMGEFAKEIETCDLEQRVKLLNEARRILHNVSPFKTEPVDFVEWVKSEIVTANDYNPNAVAPPEMELLRISIQSSGYTQPIVTMPENDIRVVIDGFHRSRVAKECADIRERVLGYAPIVTIKEDQTDKGDRIAATVQHNRARGKHSVSGMSDIVVDLKKRNWSDEKIGRQLGMDPDEVLRLTQITGLAEMFADKDFSQGWEVEIENDHIEAIN